MTDDTHDAKRAQDVAFIRSLAELLRETDLTELTVKREYGDNDWLNVRVARQTNVVHAAPAVAPLAAAVPMSASTAPIATGAADTNISDDPASAAGAISSPMVGTVYLQAEPGTPPFVAVGDKITEGQTLLIVEAMKTMNQIPAPHSGTVRRILVEDGAPVEYGALLMIID